MIECTAPKAQYSAAKAEIDASVLRVLEGGWYINGQEVREFEREFAQYIGVGHGIGVGSGTDAIHLALRALGIGVGAEVITVAHTAVATVAAIEMAGATPVFVDIDPTTFTIDANSVAAAITTKTRAIVAVHLYGHPADLDALAKVCERHGLSLIEDCAQAHGAKVHGRRVGSFGALACFSFYPTKNLGALGDGGMVVTDDAALAERVRELREYGWRERYVSAITGVNSRLDEIQAAILRVKLRGLDAANAARRERATIYDRILGASGITPVVRDGVEHVYHLYVVRTAERDRVRQQAREAGVATLVHYPVAIHEQPAYAGRIAGADRLPHTERAAATVLSLPMYPELSIADVTLAAEVVGKLCRRP